MTGLQNFKMGHMTLTTPIWGFVNPRLILDMAYLYTVNLKVLDLTVVKYERRPNNVKQL